jgi:hypothetical protein
MPVRPCHSRKQVVQAVLLLFALEHDLKSPAPRCRGLVRAKKTMTWNSGASRAFATIRNALCFWGAFCEVQFAPAKALLTLQQRGKRSKAHPKLTVTHRRLSSLWKILETASLAAWPSRGQTS